MRNCVAGIVFCCLVLLVPGTGLAADLCNPGPAAGDLMLPGPGGQCLVFRAVDIGEGSDPVAAQKRFTMGDASGGFKESPTTVSLGGSFLLGDADAASWAYYLGKYEVTEGLYYSVMGLPEGKDPALLKSMYPITSVSHFDALDFINTLNTWLYANAMDKLPTAGSMPGFLRLPTEAEWEFAARGGNNVPSDIFGNRVPYTDTLAAYEWFSGPASSHNKVQPVGGLKPNPLGLHDMLGNVSEMVGDAYQIEYYQGRNGALTSRGGHFFTREQDVRASLRTEEPMYIGGRDKGMKPNAKPTMGFRLALGAPVLADRAAINAIEEAWEPYRAGVGARLPAALSTAPADQQAGVKIDDATVYLANIKAYLGSGAGEAPESIMQDLGRLESALADTVRIRRETDEKIARSSVRTAVTTGARIARELQKIPVLEGVVQTARETDNATLLAQMEQRRSEILGNVATDMETYYDTLSTMITLNPEIAESAFALHLAYLNAPERKETSQWPALTLDLARTHYAQFFKDKTGNRDGWEQDFAAIEDPAGGK